MAEDDDLRIRWNRRGLEMARNFIVGRILDRTAQGVDVNGQRFAPYSERHKRTRAKRGLSTDTVDLRMTGSMLGTIGGEVRVDGDDFEITVAPTALGAIKAASIEAGPPRRNFLGVTDEDADDVAAIVARAMDLE